MRGDRVEVTVDIGTGVKVYDVVATRAGRRVEVTPGRTIVEVTEVTRSGRPSAQLASWPRGWWPWSNIQPVTLQLPSAARMKAGQCEDASMENRGAFALEGTPDGSGLYQMG